MTFREKLAIEHPEKIDVQCYGGTTVCPSMCGYEEQEMCMTDAAVSDEKCTACWDREIPEETLMYSRVDIASAEPRNVIENRRICNEINALYAKKNADYGDSFHNTYIEEGMAMSRIRLTDKLQRFKRLSKQNTQQVKDESIRDTLIDLACYAIMTVQELDNEENR